MSDPFASIELLSEPLTDHRGSETVTLTLRANGDLVLSTIAMGLAIEIVAGDGLNEVVSWWTVPAAQVPDVLRAALRELGRDTTTPPDGVEALEALRDVIGTEDPDDGGKMAARFVAWLSRQGLGYEFDEVAREGY